MKILGVILCRGGSKSIPYKNIVPVHGRPMIAWSILAARESEIFDRFIVVLDEGGNKKIEEALKPYEVDTVEVYQDDFTWSRDVLKKAVLEAEKKWEEKFDIIAELPAVNPLKTGEDVRNAVQLMIDNVLPATSVVSVSRVIDRHPERAKGIEGGYLFPYRQPFYFDNKEGQGYEFKEIPSEKDTDPLKYGDSRKQDLAPAYFRNGAIYVMKRHTLMELGDRFGPYPVPYLMPEERGVNVDTPLDLEFVRFLFQKNAKVMPKKIVRYEKRPIPLKDKPRILCCSPVYFLPECREELESLGGVYYMYNVLSEDLIKLQNRFSYIIPNPGASYRWDAKLIDHFDRAKMIITPSTGTNHIYVIHAEDKGIKVIGLSTDKDWLKNLHIHTQESGKYRNNESRFITASAEFTFAMIQTVVRHIPKAVNYGRSGIWRDYEDELRGEELFGKTLGVIGVGRIGNNLFHYAKAFGMKILGYDPYSPMHINYDSETLEELLEQSDIVCCCAALTEETTGMINRDVFKIMRDKQPYFINTSRGEIVNSEHLIEALEKGWIRRAGVDVVENEINMENNVLIDYAQKNPDKLIVTPHIAGLTIDSQRKAMLFVIKTLKEELK